MSTKCFSCDNRYRFFDIVLHVLVMWGSPTKFIVDDNAKVSVPMNLLYAIVFETKIKDKREKLMFLPSST